MLSVKHKTRRSRIGVVPVVVPVVVSIAFGSGIASRGRLLAQIHKRSAMAYSSKRMADGKRWMTQNLDVKTTPSYCYDGLELNCRRYGRLYTWESAQRACRLLGDGWRLPTDEEWRQLARDYGGLLKESIEKGRSSYKALRAGGSSGFSASVGGGRSPDGKFVRLEDHGFYWTASESGAGTAWFYNFSQGLQALSRLTVEKQWALSVRCIHN